MEIIRDDHDATEHHAVDIRAARTSEMEEIMSPVCDTFEEQGMF